MTDAIVVGSGPNGLAAAVTLARAGLDVTVFEAQDSPGGSARTFDDPATDTRHDWGSAVHPMAFASPFFTAFDLSARVSFVTPEASYAHPLEGGRAGIAWQDLDRTASELGNDERAWRRLLSPLVERAAQVAEFALSPMVPLPSHPLLAAGYGLRALEQGSFLGKVRFKGDVAPAMLAGVYAHTIGSLPSLTPAAAGLMLATTAHTAGWPIPVGGSQSIVSALVDDLLAYGGKIETGAPVRSLDELPPARAVLFDTSAATLARIGGDRLHPRYRRALTRLRNGNAASKVDFVLSEPVPWANADVASAGTFHIGGDRREVALAEHQVAAGQHAERPYVLASQPSLFDSTRAPEGLHTLWSYAHVPAGSTRDMTESVIEQIERFAPGFRDTIVASTATTAVDLERGNANLTGGDIAAGAITLRQLLARPVLSRKPWKAGAGLFLCSAAAVPGPGVHGMGGFHAAKLALREVFGLDVRSLEPK
ncbi:MAG TPA: NAD(P)/FAD-dependent oxidoreductase [Candidatus Agrococcus pullicola]|uniref:NAD(P)/FAD-dependent oxidoreductase n=1 Tax=Candidatus Agrococcus pullicola TaxID=2838429 RepID=A0A9D1YU35_9MICO|nr:NAD(P)/FAD-dependent oxidoreductase [Candidatus Agrococcus pullicola]